MNEKHKFYVLFVLIAISILPFLTIVKLPTSWTNFRDLSLYLSSFCGYVGVALMLWMFILGTRSIIGLYFNDLPKTLKIHRWLGTYGLIFILLHPIFIALHYSENFITYTLLPNISSEFEKHVTFGRIAFLSMAIIWLTSAIVRGKIAYRPWKYIHYLSYVALPLSFLHVPTIGSSFGQQLVQVYWYSFIAIFMMCTALRMRHLFGYGKVSYKIIEHTQISSDVYLLVLEAIDAGVHVQSGQYVYVQRSLYSEEHPFTVVDYDNMHARISIAYKVFGSYTKKMAQMAQGDTLLIDGPYGTFTQDMPVDVVGPAVFIAGGIGITPFIKHVMQDSDSQHWLFYANQSKKSAVFRDYLKSKMGNRYIDIFSREPDVQQNNTETGHISSEVFKKYLPAPQACKYYICGPQGLIDTAKQNLLDLGVASYNIHAEEFNF